MTTTASASVASPARAAATAAVAITEEACEVSERTSEKTAMEK